MEPYGIGIDIGGTRIKGLALNAAGEVLDSFVLETNDSSDPDWPEEVKQAVESVESDRGALAEWIGLAAPGLAARNERSIEWMSGRMSALQGLDWARRLDREHPVIVLNDAHAALLGEVWLGAAKGMRDAVMVTLGTGVGGAILARGELLRGHIGRAGHLGHITLNSAGPPDIVGTPGSLEDAVGECSLPSRSAGRFTKTVELVEACRAQDMEANRIWRESLRHLACGLVSIINMVDPAVVVLGGGIAQAKNDLLEPLKQELERIEWRPHDKRVKVVLAQLGDRAGAFGAAQYARDRIEKSKVKT